MPQFSAQRLRPLTLAARQRAASKAHAAADRLVSAADDQGVRDAVYELVGIGQSLAERINIVTESTEGAGYCTRCERWMFPVADGDDLQCSRCRLVL